MQILVLMLDLLTKINGEWSPGEYQVNKLPQMIVT